MATSTGLPACSRLSTVCRKIPPRGSATGATAALLASIETSETEVRRYSVAQGVDMGRPSLIEVVVQIADGNSNIVRVGGYCVDIMQGWLDY